ncbi:hypothetical protein F5887DRAFT_957690 [Amanita rubescens]|nr:hypothetical protein F5887DRAFT_957690 [Amanita rubescens]
MLPTIPGGEVKEALNALCGYWMCLRDRIMDQIVWEDRGRKLGSENVEDKHEKWGMILPRVILRGTVTCRAFNVNCFQREKERLRVRTESSGLCTTRLHDRR